MRRAGFGARPEEIAAILSLGVDRTIDLLLTAGQVQLQESGVQVLPHGEVLYIAGDLNHQRAQWLHHMATTLYPLQEKMVLFWSDHFSVGAENANYTPLLPQLNNVLRRHALGSFRQMLIDVTKNPAMLFWLDNNVNGRLVNSVPTINENYGRELLELYTMGVNAGYTQADVVQVSRVLSGMSTVDLGFSNQYLYRPTWHVTGTKQVSFGSGPNGDQPTTIPAGTAETELDFLLDNAILRFKPTAEYMVTKVWEYFVEQGPSPALVTELANRWRSTGYNIRALMSIVLRSSYFFSDAAIGALVKNPVEYVVGVIRNLNMPFAGTQSFITMGLRIETMGYPLLRYSNPSGLADGVAWIDSSTVIARANFANELSATAAGSLGAQFQTAWMREIATHGLSSATAIVDHYLNVLVGGNVPGTVRDQLLDFMNRIDAGYEPFRMFNPNGTLNTAKINEKVRGLVHLILALPEYQIN
jgi:uncharacterized protein (DUF1800 family)